MISQPDAGEQALEIADTLVKSGSISVIVIDSVAALTPKAEIEGEMGDHHVGLQSRLMSQALRKLTGSISNTNTNDDFHKSNQNENWSYVWKSRNNIRWKCT